MIQVSVHCSNVKALFAPDDDNNYGKIVELQFTHDILRETDTITVFFSDETKARAFAAAINKRSS